MSGSISAVARRRGASSNRRLIATEVVLLPVTASGIAAAAHYWQHQPWLGAIAVGAFIAVGLTGVRWWQYRR